MYCPNCAAPIDGVKFCRQCGANVSLVPQALTGQFVAPDPTNPTPSMMYTAGQHIGRSRRNRERHNKPPNIEAAVSSVFWGIGMFIAALAIGRFMPGGAYWWFWMLIPAFGAMGHGVGEYLRFRAAQQQPSLPSPALPTSMMQPPIPTQASTPVPTTSELQLPAAATPASITEHTTALLEPARQKSAERN